jgi:hypothetical protein
MTRITELHDNLNIMFDLQKQGITGESDCSKVAEGKHHLKSKMKFNALKWTLQLCPILFVIYIIVKAII